MATFEYRRLSIPTEAEEFKELAARAHHPFLVDPNYANDVLVVGATKNGKPIGLLICVIRSATDAEYLSVFVRREERLQGVATKLFQFAEAELKASGIKTLLIMLSQSGDSTPIRGVMRSSHWDMDPAPFRSMMVSSDQRENLASGWRNKNLSSPRLEIFEWEEVRPQEIEELERESKREDRWFPSNLSPLIDGKHLYQPLCIGLRIDGELIGWALSHRFKSGPISVSILFAKAVPDYPMAGFCLIQELVNRFLKLAEQEPYLFECMIREDNKFFKFIDRRVLSILEHDLRNIFLFKRLLS